jgi:hypothetical protein
VFLGDEYFLMRVEGELFFLLRLSLDSFRVIDLMTPSSDLLLDEAWTAIDKITEYLSVLSSHRDTSASGDYLACADEISCYVVHGHNATSQPLILRLSIDQDRLRIVHFFHLSSLMPSPHDANGTACKFTALQLSSKFGYLMLTTDQGTAILISTSSPQKAIALPFQYLCPSSLLMKMSALTFYHADQDDNVLLRIATIHHSRVYLWKVKTSILSLQHHNSFSPGSSSSHSKIYADHVIQEAQNIRTAGPSIGSIAAHPHRLLFFIIDRSNRISLIQKSLISDFPGPQYPIGFKLIQRVIPYFEAEDELDRVPSTVPKETSPKVALTSANGPIELIFHAEVLPNMIPLNIDSFNHLTISKFRATVSLKQNAVPDFKKDEASAVAEEKSYLEEFLPMSKRLKSGEFMKSILDARGVSSLLLVTRLDN